MHVDTAALLTWMKARSKEPSTMRGILGLLLSLGVVVDPANIDAIIALFIALISLVNVFKRDYSSPDAKEKKPSA